MSAQAFPRRILISCDLHEVRAALLEDNTLIGYQVESAETARKRGNIYRGRVTAIEQSLEAAFVAYLGAPGTAKEGFLPLEAVVPKSLETITGKKIGKRRAGLGVGDYVLVQVVQEEVGNKGATLTMDIAIPGRFVVLMPFSDKQGVSRKLQENERSRLRKILEQVRVPSGFGVIMRTSSEMTDRLEDVQAELNQLLRTWEGIVRKFKQMKSVGKIYSEPSLPVRFVRDFMTSDVCEVLVDDRAIFEDLQNYSRTWMPERAGVLKFWNAEEPLFSAYGVERQVEALLNNVVPLSSGGNLVIQETEALVAIDVNSGKGKRGDAERTALATNLEAAREIARQVILRDLGGILVVDFVGMESEEHRRAVEQEIKAAFQRDKSRLCFGSINEFGLFVFSRQRMGAQVGMFVPCEACGGTGRVCSARTLAVSAMRMLREKLAKTQKNIVRVEIVAPPTVAEFLNNRMREDLVNIEKGYGVSVEVKGARTCGTREVKVFTFGPLGIESS